MLLIVSVRPWFSGGNGGRRQDACYITAPAPPPPRGAARHQDDRLAPTHRDALRRCVGLCRWRIDTATPPAHRTDSEIMIDGAIQPWEFITEGELHVDYMIRLAAELYLPPAYSKSSRMTPIARGEIASSG